MHYLFFHLVVVLGALRRLTTRRTVAAADAGPGQDPRAVQAGRGVRQLAQRLRHGRLSLVLLHPTDLLNANLGREIGLVLVATASSLHHLFLLLQLFRVYFVHLFAQDVEEELRGVNVSLGITGRRWLRGLVALAHFVLLLEHLDQLHEKLLSVRPDIRDLSRLHMTLDHRPILAVYSERLEESLVLLLGPAAETPLLFTSRAN